MKRIIPTALLAVTGMTGLGLLGLQTVDQEQRASAAEVDAAFTKRDDDSVELVLVDDDDDNDTADDTRSRNTGISRATGDNTRSNFTKVSRDRDLSRSDKTRDWTGDKTNGQTRDRSANATNDRSRNDTRR